MPNLPLTLLSKGITKASKAVEFVEWFREQGFVSDGHLVFKLNPGPPLLLVELSKTNSPIDSFLDTYVYLYFNQAFQDPLAQLDMNFDITMNGIPQELAKLDALVKRHTSTIFKFKSELISFFPKTGTFQPIIPGNRIWNQMMIRPYFIREIDLPWREGLDSSASLGEQLWSSPLTKYLLHARNMPHSIVFFFVMLGRLLHLPHQYDKWTEILSVSCPIGESVLILLIRLLFESRDIFQYSALKCQERIDPRPIQLSLCYVESRGTKAKQVVLPKVPKNTHYVIYGDLKNIIQDDVRTLTIHDAFSTANSSFYLTLRSELPCLIQLASRVYWFTLKTLGSHPNCFSSNKNWDNLFIWMEMWNIPCPICKSRSLCPHIFNS